MAFYDPIKLASLIKQWKFTTTECKRIYPQTEKVIYTYNDTKSGLLEKYRVSSFNEFKAIEWILNFINTAAEHSAVIEKAALIDQSFSSKQAGEFMR